MPSLGIHLLVADRAFSLLAASPNQETQALAPVVRYQKEMAALGAIGPDLFYYLGEGPKISAAVADVFNFLDQLASILTPVSRLAQQAGLPNVGQRIGQLGELTKLAVGTSQVGLLASIVALNEAITGSYLFKPSPQQEGKGEHDWNWGDILHDRVSGKFATKLLTRARTAQDFPLMAYATGYMTHLATDFVGHAYVNTVVGGPARGWNIRHTVAEKFMDASVFARRGPNSDINTAALDRRFSTLAQTPRLANLCDSLTGLVRETAADAQLGFTPPDLFDAGDLNDAFNAMCSLFSMVTNHSYVEPPQPPGITIPPIPGQYGTLTHAVTGLGSGGRPRTLTDWLKFLLALLLLVPAVMADMVRFVTDVALGVITYPLAAAVYVFESYLYSLYRQVRWYLVISGVLFPCKDELTDPLALQFVTSKGGFLENYPHQLPTITLWPDQMNSPTDHVKFTANNFDYLNYPTTPTEKPSTRPSPYPPATTPELFMFDLKRDDAFVASWLTQTTPANLRALVGGIRIAGANPIGGFGNAADLSVLLLSRPDIAMNLNLDSDRGYGYRQWKANAGAVPSGDVSGSEVFIP